MALRSQPTTSPKLPIDAHAVETIATLHIVDDHAKYGNSPRRYNPGSSVDRSGIHSPRYAWLAPWSLPSRKDITTPTLTLSISGIPSPTISTPSILPFDWF